MLSSKERAYLRSLANSLVPVFQIGKEGISQNLIVGLGEALESRELIKVAILETAGLDVKQAADMAAQSLCADIVQCVGRKFVLYRESKNNHVIILPK